MYPYGTSESYKDKMLFVKLRLNGSATVIIPATKCIFHYVLCTHEIATGNITITQYGTMVGHFDARMTMSYIDNHLVNQLLFFKIGHSLLCFEVSCSAMVSWK